MIVRDDSFAIFAAHLAARSGLELRRDQDYLLAARLSSLLELYSCTTLDELAVLVKHKHSARLLRQIAEAMATHETSFFRDPKIFSYLKDILLPDILRQNVATKTIRIWSAGCATGQEAYSLAILLHDLPFDLTGWRIDLVATDLSDDIIARAKSGLYSHFEAQRGLAIRQLVMHFIPENDAWRINDSLAARVSFHTLNLLDDFSALGSFDIILCRNVLIYVDRTAKQNILARLHRSLKSDGTLILGAVETVLDNNGSWENTAMPGVFKRP